MLLLISKTKELSENYVALKEMLKEAIDKLQN